MKPHDTINAVVRAGSHFHGTVELTWASPTQTRPIADAFVVTGTDGWLSVNQTSVAGSSILRVKITSVVKVEGQPDTEKEEIIEAPATGVETELASFFDTVLGKDDGLGLGDPLGALRDVAFIEAGLNSDGNLVDLMQLVPASL